MGWTHDYSDVSRNRRRTSNKAASMDSMPERSEQAVDQNRLAPALGIPSILGRRARWMTARLRHVRD